MKKTSDWEMCWKAYAENSRNPLQNKVSENNFLRLLNWAFSVSDKNSKSS